jgi:hypothetical protein
VRSTVIEGFEGFDGHVLQHEGMRGQQITSWHGPGRRYWGPNAASCISRNTISAWLPTTLSTNSAQGSSHHKERNDCSRLRTKSNSLIIYIFLHSKAREFCVTWTFHSTWHRHVHA